MTCALDDCAGKFRVRVDHQYVQRGEWVGGITLPGVDSPDGSDAPSGFQSLTEWIDFAGEQGIPPGKALALWDRMLDDTKPSDSAIVERAIRLGNNAVGAVGLQVKRIRDGLAANPLDESDDRIFDVFDADIPFLIIALTWVRRAALVAKGVAAYQDHIDAAITRFDKALPALLKMRNVREHIEDYALEAPARGQQRRTQRRADGRLIGRRVLEVMAITDGGFRWLNEEIKFDVALQATFDLYDAICDCRQMT